MWRFTARGCSAASEPFAIGYRTAMNSKLLGIYLNDHSAGSVTGAELAKRARDNNEGTELGTFLAGIVDEIESDREALAAIMDSLDVTPDPVKRSVAWAAEKVGRFKPNGQLGGYSPLSRLIELEGLMLGVSGKLGLWRALIACDVDVPAAIDLQRLAASAERQRDELEEWRLRAAQEAFSASTAAVAGSPGS